MSYATGRAYFDADSHLMETPDWLARYADPELRDRLLPLALGKAGAGPEKKIAAAMERVKDPKATDDIARDVIAGPKGWGALGAFAAAERSRALDDLGFSRQLVFTTFAATQFLGAPDPDVVYGGLRAHNRAIADFCSADDRLIPVGMVSLDDPARALAEIEAAIRLKIGAVWIPAAPSGGKSPGHPDFDPIWGRLSEAGIPFVLHIGLGTRVLPKDYENNGRPLPADIHGGGENIRVKDYMVLSFAPQMFLSAVVFDGVFERFPALRGGAIELGASWVPDFLRRLDRGAMLFSKGDPALAALSLRPSEYFRRQFKFTPFPGEHVGALVKDAGSELFMFSSDYPHPEGTNDPIGRFAKTMTDLSEEERDLFFARNFEAMVGGA
ncbi:MAG TPA: amidohydrolase family protein [Polyangiaceae bacterium]|nr:amidohydrolase family protein [Polyangiaceae bacterium]